MRYARPASRSPRLEVGLGVVPEAKALDGEHLRASVVAADDVDETSMVRLGPPAPRAAPVLLLRSRDELAVHVEANRVARAIDSPPVPHSRHVDPASVQAGDRRADTAVGERAGEDWTGVARAEGDFEVETRVRREDLVLDEELDVGACQRVRAAEDAVRVVDERLGILRLLV